jgi:hypothetical protein
VPAIRSREIDVTVAMNDYGYKASGLVKVITELAPPIAVHDITEAPIMLSLNLGESFLRAGSVEPVRATE